MTTHFMYGISDVKEERYINVNTGPNLGDNSFLDTDPNFPQMDSHTRRMKNRRTEEAHCFNRDAVTIAWRPRVGGDRGRVL